MQADNRRDDRQPQAETALRVAAFGAVETLEHRLAFGHGNTRAGVEHFDACVPLLIDSTQNHVATGWRELDRVAEQVRHGFEQQCPVTVEQRQVVGQLQAEVQFTFFGQGQVKVMQFLQQRHRIELHESGSALAVFQLGNTQQPAKARHQGIGFCQYRVQL
ncbi:hypothetical protein D9M70_569430 [compost metagenome]